jgi:DNA (cytosine-5)-methyltransferase 1
MSELTHVDLFSGIMGFSVAFGRHGFKTVARSEVDPKCEIISRRHYPGVPNIGDIETAGGKYWRGVDVVTFGSPCQDLSVAGNRGGLGGSKSRLFYEAVRFVREARPRFAVWENVVGALSSNKGWDFAAVLDQMADAGAMDIAWRVLDAQWFGVPQRRRRVFLVADFGGERAGEVLSISEGVLRYPEPSREEGQEDALDSMDRATFASSGRGWWSEADVAATVDASQRSTYETNLEVTVPFAFALRGREEGARPEVSGDKTSSIRGEGGSGRDYIVDAIDVRNIRLQGGVSGTLQSKKDGGYSLNYTNPVVVAVAENQRAEMRVSDTAPSLSGTGGKPGQGYPAILEGYNVHGEHSSAMTSNGDAEVMYPTEVSRSIDTTGGYATNQGGTVALEKHPPIAFHTLQDPISGPVSPAMGTGTTNGYASIGAVVGLRVRRLTPRECERLQGFPDDWTAGVADSHRYRMLGNAVAVPPVEHIAEGVRRALA